MNRRNIPSSPIDSTKRRKLDQFEPTSSPVARFKSTQNGPKGKVGSSQPSQFESEVLEKMSGLKKNNAESGQEWSRPGLGNFNPEKDNLIFQQIDVEEGTLHAAPAVKLFGVTEASQAR